MIMKNYICNCMVFLFQMQCLKILLGISSYPIEFFGLWDLIILIISASITKIIFIFVILYNYVPYNNFIASPMFG